MKKRVFSIFSILGILALMLNLSPPIPAKASTSVFINEIHYDNVGSDSGEAIEIAGPSSLFLEGWSLILYNGINGVHYDTITLNGTITDQQNGFGTLSFEIAGIQNGAPDGVALVDASDNVVQFLSYEGTFTAVDGPAIGMLSTDIGVSEDGSGAVGMSLQLTGAGTTYNDFTWAADAPNTFGAVNTGQIFNGPVPTIPSGTGAADPDSVHAGDTTLLTVVVTPGENPASTGLAVKCDLTDIGGSSTQALNDNGTNGDVSSGDNIFSYLATVDGATSIGEKHLSCTITDDYPRSGNSSIGLTVVAKEHFFIFLPLVLK